MIYFLSVSLAEDVHVQAQGFTSYLNLFAWGDTPQQAEENGRAYLLGNDVEVKKFYGTSVSLQQNLARFTFPEQIYGAPEDLAIAAIRAKDYPESITNSTLARLRKKLSQLHAGRTLLAERVTA